MTSESNPFFPPAPDSASPELDAEGARPILLVKDGRRFVFRYRRESASDLVAEIRRLADDPDSPVDWFDAAALARQIGDQLRRTLENPDRP